MAVNGVSSNQYGSYYTYNYGYNSSSNSTSGIDSSSWTDNANKVTDQLKDSLGISDSKDSTSTSSSNKASSTSSFLMGYQTRLEELETSASKLQLGNKDNVFDKYDAVKAKVEKGEATEDDLNKAADEVYQAVKDLTEKYNNTISYLKNNGEHGDGLSAQLESLKRAVPTDQGLKYFGMSHDTNGNLKIDEEKFKETFKNDSDYVKNSFGGQFGIADRLGTKASAILDSSVDEVLNSGTTSGTGEKKATSSEPVETYGASSVNTKNAANVNDSFKQFATFARSGAYNLSNYYAVSMLNILA